MVMETKEVDMADGDETCPSADSGDHQHCSCLYDGYECCWCGAPPLADDSDMDPGDCNDALGG